MAYSRMHLEIKRVEGNSYPTGEKKGQASHLPTMPQWCWGYLSSCVRLGHFSIHDFLLRGFLKLLCAGDDCSSLCSLWTRSPLVPPPPLSSLFPAAACKLVHKQNRSYIAQHALMALWWCVSDSDFSSPQSLSCSPLNRCLAGGSIKSLSSGLAALLTTW